MMKLHGKKHNSRSSKDNRRRKIVGTRSFELFFSPLPIDATISKVKELLRPTGVQCKDIRIHKGGKACSAFVVYHCDADAAAALKAFRSDPLYVQEKRIEVRYTINYSDETTNHCQQVTARIKQSFSWLADNNICVRDLPKELENIVGTTNFTDINTSFSCNERHTECAFFCADSKLVEKDPNENLPIQPPEVVTYKTSEIQQLYKKYQEPVTHCAKLSKSSRKKTAKKKQALAKIEAQLSREANFAPLAPGLGRGFCQKTTRSSASINKPTNHNTPINKPFAIICPTKREDIISLESQNKNAECISHRTQNVLQVQGPSPTMEKNVELHHKSPSGIKECGSTLFTQGINPMSEAKDESKGASIGPLVFDRGIGRGRGAGIATLSNDMLRELSKI